MWAVSASACKAPVVRLCPKVVRSAKQLGVLVYLFVGYDLFRSSHHCHTLQCSLIKAKAGGRDVALRLHVSHLSICGQSSRGAAAPKKELSAEQLGNLFRL
jgi:hypothetical protein